MPEYECTNCHQRFFGWFFSFNKRTCPDCGGYIDHIPEYETH